MPRVQLLALLLVQVFSRKDVRDSHAQDLNDNRCFLESGGSVDTFFVGEDFPAGEVIGTLHIIGDPSEDGNITLRLLQQDSPAAIVPGTKNISLTRRLDKEGVDGPSNVNINVICDRKNTIDEPSFVIPVNIRVRDTNDNAPKFLNGTYALDISEMTPLGTRVLQGVKAVDADQHGPFSTVQYSVLPGLHSEYFAFANGLEGTLVLQKPLDYEKISNFSIGIRAEDQGSPPRHSDATLQVKVTDADDQNPRFCDERYTALLPEQASQGTRLGVRPRHIAAYDQDQGINASVLYSLHTAGAPADLFQIDSATGHVLLRRSVEVEELRAPATLVLRATQQDNPDRYALATLTVERATAASGGAAQAAATVTAAAASLAPTPVPIPVLPAPSPPAPRFLQRVFTTRALESLPPGSRLLHTLTNRPLDTRLRFWLGDDADTKIFEVTSTGEIMLLRPLDYGARKLWSFTVHVGDGAHNDSARAEVEVAEVKNCPPRFLSSEYAFSVQPTALRGALVGRVQALCGDGEAVVHLELGGPDLALFAINDAGEITLTADATLARVGSAQLVAVASSAGRPPRLAVVPVVVRFAGTAAADGASGLTPGQLVLYVLGGVLIALAVVALLLLYLRVIRQRKGRGILDGQNGAEDDVAEARAAYRVVYAASGRTRSRSRRFVDNDPDPSEEIWERRPTVLEPLPKVRPPTSTSTLTLAEVHAPPPDS